MKMRVLRSKIKAVGRIQSACSGFVGTKPQQAPRTAFYRFNSILLVVL